MTGRAEVQSHQARIDATFKRAQAVTADLESLSDFAKYLCILVAGFLEQSVIEILREHSRRTSAPSIQRFVDRRLRQFTNAKAQRLVDLLTSFDVKWGQDLNDFVVDERKAAVDSVVDLRNTLSHGRYAGVTLRRISDYYMQIKDVVQFIAELCIPD